MKPETDNRSRFEDCVENCADSMYRVAFRLTGNQTLAAELVQETYLSAWKSIESLKDKRRMRAWMFAILRNQYTKQIRKEKRFVTELQTANEAASKTNECNETADRVQEALNQLDDEHKLPILLVSIEGMSVNEAANVLGLPRGTVLSRMHRGREKLKQILTRDQIRSEEK